MPSISDFYAPLGFRIVPLFAYAGDAPVGAACVRSRRLNPVLEQDRHLLARILCRRVPVSNRFAVDGLAGCFVLNLFDRPDLSAWYVEPAEAVVVTAGRTDGTLCIVDIAAAWVPPLDEIAAAFGNLPRRTEVHFPPDRLAWQGTAIPVQSPTVLMVRGE